MRVQFVEINGLMTRLFTAGSGPLLMLVHPVGYPAEIYARNVDELSSAYTVVAADLPGQGHTEAPARWHAAPQVVMASHTAAVASHLGFDDYSIVGSSLGGLVAALTALNYPDRVRRLVLIGTGSVFNEPSGQPAILQKVYANGSRAYSDPSMDTCRARIAATCFRAPAADDILLSHLSAYALPGAAANYRYVIDQLSATIADASASAYPRLEELSMPTLIIVGNDDTRTSYASHLAGAVRIRDAQILRMSECGHLPFLEQQERFNGVLLQFLDGVEVGERVQPM
jgi:2-hydroxy-6-oxonona-2,4-dienedioate hydrolase